MASYQIARSGTKTGPFDEAEVRAKLADGSIVGSDLCWTQGMETWLPVSQVFEIEVAVPATGAMEVPAATAATAAGTPGPQAGGIDPMSLKQPPTHMVSAILATLLCCLPLGIVAIVYASKVSALYQAGHYHGALEASDKAKFWSNMSVLVVLLIILAVGLYETFVGPISVE